MEKIYGVKYSSGDYDTYTTTTEKVLYKRKEDAMKRIKELDQKHLISVTQEEKNRVYEMYDAEIENNAEENEAYERMARADNMAHDIKYYKDIVENYYDPYYPAEIVEFEVR